jgi:hypothetical protein
MPVVAVVAVAAPAGEVLQGGSGGPPVAPTARAVAARFGAQQPAGVGPVPPVGHGRPLPAVASAMGALATAAALPLLLRPVGPLDRERDGRRRPLLRATLPPPCFAGGGWSRP